MSTVDDDASPEELEARRAGFRTLSKERWEALQAEYIEYRDGLLRRIAAASSAAALAAYHPSSSTTPTQLQGEVHHAHTRTETPPLSYPRGCVIFARHVPQDTNKTALRAQFSALLADHHTVLDYVDYTKGLDSVRLLHMSKLRYLIGVARGIVLSPPSHAGRRDLAPEAIRGTCEGGERDYAGVAGGTKRGDVLGESA
jgi:xRRM domain